MQMIFLDSLLVYLLLQPYITWMFAQYALPLRMRRTFLSHTTTSCSVRTLT